MKTAKLRLPATSANLGPGFDSLALALKLFLEIEANTAAGFSIEATGRDREICGALQNNLLIECYRRVLSAERRSIPPLSIRMHNGIPLGMGCGSSAAVRLAGVALAAHFGSLPWSPERIVETAARLEGHPDNVAACWYGGLTVAAAGEPNLSVVSISPPSEWRAILVLPEMPVATSRSRAILPDTYSAKDTVASVQRVALLTAAFALRRPDLLAVATEDVLHQPYRVEICPFLPALLPLAGRAGVLSVTLSGAGPSVLILHHAGEVTKLKKLILEEIQESGPAELVEAELWGEGASIHFGS